MLQIIDLAYNNLSGEIPGTSMTTWKEMMVNKYDSPVHLGYSNYSGDVTSIRIYYGDAVTITSKGNKGLWGPPLTAYEKAGLPVPPPASNDSRRSSGHEINWDLISVEIGFVFGFGVAIGSLAFYKRWRNWYYKATLNIIFKMFPQLHQRLGNQGRHVYINQRRRR
ncbi:receptor-like protein 12 [Prunus yedoensis var. nudiflora]|uniref:Receptor-like protein 12 n=1 Tax=Prunus yedoensis var. nudiflora TaxID=2094558 RepID=A0A314XKW6_PRUYE|nr:receptor-like protein 12 [Prunus yedoensis var. nudiflora]